jgi:WD40 repeat protein/uncharacterized caspase-like protein
MLKRFILLLLLLTSVADVEAQPDQTRLVVQTGHSNNVSTVAFSPDGKTLASGSWDNTIKLWEVATGQELRTLTGHSSYVTAVAFSPDGKMLASGSWDKTIRFWNLVSGEELRILKGHSGFITAVAFSPDGKTLASASWDKTVKLWDVASGQEVRTLPGHVNYVNSVAFSSDGQTLASGSSDKTIRLWSVTSGQEIRMLTGHANDVTTVAFSPNGKILASGSDDNTVKLWDAESGQELRSLTGHSEGIRGLAFSPDGTIIVSGSWDKTTKVWNVDSGQEIRSLVGHSNYVTSVSFSPQGKTLASGSWDRTIKLWNVADGHESQTLAGHSSSITAVAFSPDGTTLASGGFDRTIKLWQMTRGRGLRTLEKHSSYITSLAFSPDGRTLASGSYDKTIKLWDLTRDQELRTLTGHTLTVRSVAFSSDGKMLASGGDDKSIILWDVAGGQKLRTLTGHSDIVRSVAFSPDNKTLASGSWDKTVKFWDVATGQELRSLKGHSDYVTAVAFSPNGETLASASWDNTIKLWQVATGQEMKTLTGHSAGVLALSFSADGKTLASGSDDKTARLWDLNGTQQPTTLVGQSVVYSVAFSPGGNTVATGNGGARVRLWSRGGEELVSLISLDENDWSVVTPNGLFDASPAGRKLMHYVVGMEVITLDQMKDLYYSPRLLQRAVTGESLPKLELFKPTDLFPEADFQPLRPGQLKFTVKLKNRGGGIGPVQVLVNGTEMTADARPPGTNPQAREVTLEIDLSKAKQVLPDKENKVEVIARNADSSLSSKGSVRGVVQVFTGVGNRATGPPHLYAIVGGVSKFVKDDLNLRYSSKDASDFARVLALGASKFLGRDNVHIRLLATDRPEGNGESIVPDTREFPPSKENFQKVFAEFAGRVKPEDILIVYLSGHGVALKQANGDSYLYLIQEAYTTDNDSLLVESVRTATTIMSDELVRWIGQIPALKKALVLDTCAAGLAAKSFGSRSDVSPDQERALERLKDRTGFFVLMGSAADKVSYETTRYRQGLLTYSILEALKGAKLHDNYANVGDVFSYTQDRVPKLAENIGAIQQPQYFQPDIGGAFDIGLYTQDIQALWHLPAPNPLVLRPQLQNVALGYDNLKLTPAFQKALVEASFMTRGTNEVSLVFVDATDMQDAFLPSGSYTIEGDKVVVNLNLIRNGERTVLQPLEGSVADEPSRSALIQKMITAVSVETQKAIDTADQQR